MPSLLANTASWVHYWSQTAGERLAIVDSTRRLSYRDLEGRVARLATWLREQGIRRGDRVAVLLANGSPYLELILAASRIGAIGLPINSRLAPGDLHHILTDSSPSLLFYSPRFEKVVEEAARKRDARSFPRQFEVGGTPDRYESEIMAEPRHGAIEPLSLEDPMMLMYTSGSSGAPKGALLPHRKTLFNCLNAQLYFGLRAEDRILVCTPLFHSLGLNILSLPALYAGASLVIHDGFDPGAVWHDVAHEGVTYLGAVPTQYQRLFDALGDSRAGPFPSLRFCFTAGAAIPVELVHAYADRGLVLKQGYGQTETSILACLSEDDAVRKAGSVGQPVFHGEVRVVPREDIPLSPDSWRTAAPGETGEIVVRGPIQMLGYWKQPGETREIMRGDWLRTTDLGHCDDEGFLTLSGRVRDMFISGGENVYPAEVEAVYEGHPSIAEIAIVGIESRQWGEVGRAHVVMNPGEQLDPDALVAWGRERLASFKIPREFLLKASLPRTASGKVQKYLL